MNLWKHTKHKTYYIWYSRSEYPPDGKRIPLKTKDFEIAKALLRAHKADWLENKLIDLKGRGKFVKLSAFYDEYKQARTDKTKDTLRLDRLAFGKLIESAGDKTLAMFTVRDIDHFKTVLTVQKLKHSTINTYLRRIRTAFNVAVEWEYLSKPLKIKMLKEAQRLPQALSKDEIRTILKYTLKHDYEMWRVIIFALYTGCRRGEIANVRYQDIKDKSVQVVGKGNRQRSVPLSDTEELSRAIGVGDIGFVFRIGPGQNISRRFKRIVRALGLPESIHFHSLRHSAATFMLSCGIDLAVVQKILGHTSIRTTEIYAKVMDEVAKKDIQKLNFE